jgi:hypothetical protein
MPPFRRRVVSGLAFSSVAVVVACSGSASSTPAGSGNDVIDDTRDAARPPPNPDPNPPDADMDGPLYDGPNEAGYPLLSACDGCTCDPSRYYCYGGATRRAAPVAGHADGGSDGGTCPVANAASDASDPGLAPQIGCNTLPKGCTDCSCVIATLQPAYSCYLVCAFDGAQMLVYCPSP